MNTIILLVVISYCLFVFLTGCSLVSSIQVLSLRWWIGVPVTVSPFRIVFAFDLIDFSLFSLTCGVTGGIQDGCAHIWCYFITELCELRPQTMF